MMTLEIPESSVCIAAHKACFTVLVQAFRAAWENITPPTEVLQDFNTSDMFVCSLELQEFTKMKQNNFCTVKQQNDSLTTYDLVQIRRKHGFVQ